MTPKEFNNYFNVSRETISDFCVYENLLKKWNIRKNLVSKKSLPHVWRRHFLDSAQIVNHCNPEKKLWVDMGAGAGFPGVVIAIILRDRGIKTDLVLVEKSSNKVFFLNELKRSLDLSFDVICGKAEEIKPLKADIISARAFCPLELLLPLTKYHGKKDCVSIFLKGKNLKEEIDKTSKIWFFQYDILSSVSSDEGRLLKIKTLYRLT